MRDGSAQRVDMAQSDTRKGPFYLKKWFTIPARGIVAAVLGFVFAYVLVSTFAKPEFVVVATYGRAMPWDFLLESSNSEFPDCHNVLTRIVHDWEKLYQDVRDDFTRAEYFEIDSISRSDWKTSLGDLAPVQDAYDTLQMLHPECLTNASNLLRELQKTSTIPTTNHRDHLVVAMTPDRSSEISRIRLNGLSNAVQKALMRDLSKVKVQTWPCQAYEEVITNLAAGKIDFAVCSPFSAFIAERATNKIKLLGRTKKRSEGEARYGVGYNVDLIRKTSEVPLVELIADKRQHYTFIYSSQYSTSGYLIGLRMLDGLGLWDEVTISEISSNNHDDVIRAVSHSDGNYLASVPSDRTAEHQKGRGSAALGAAIGVLIGTASTLIILGVMRRLSNCAKRGDILGIVVVACAIGTVACACLSSSAAWKAAYLAVAITVPGFYLFPFARIASEKSQQALRNQQALGLLFAEFIFACLPLLISFFRSGYYYDQTILPSQWGNRFLSQPEISLVAAVLFGVSAYKSRRSRLMLVTSLVCVVVVLMFIPYIWLNERDLANPLVRLQLVPFFLGSVMFFGAGIMSSTEAGSETR